MIYLLAGHTIVNGRGTGAFGVDGFDEAVEAARLRDDLTAELRKRGKVVINDVDTTPLGKVVSWLRSKVTKTDRVIEIHFNASLNKNATGVEAYIDDSHTRQEYIEALGVVNCVSRTLGLKSRGVKKESESQHKSLAIISVPSAAINVLVEICFISNPNDIAAYRKNYRLMVEALADYWSND